MVLKLLSIFGEVDTQMVLLLSPGQQVHERTGKLSICIRISEACGP